MQISHSFRQFAAINGPLPGTNGMAFTLPQRGFSPQTSSPPSKKQGGPPPCYSIFNISSFLRDTVSVLLSEGSLLHSVPIVSPSSLKGLFILSQQQILLEKMTLPP